MAGAGRGRPNPCASGRGSAYRGRRRGRDVDRRNARYASRGTISCCSGPSKTRLSKRRFGNASYSCGARFTDLRGYVRRLKHAGAALAAAAGRLSCATGSAIAHYGQGFGNHAPLRFFKTVLITCLNCLNRREEAGGARGGFGYGRTRILRAGRGHSIQEADNAAGRPGYCGSEIFGDGVVTRERGRGAVCARRGLHRTMPGMAGFLRRGHHRLHRSPGEAGRLHLGQECRLADRRHIA